MVSCTDWDRELLTQMSEVYSSSGDASAAMDDDTYSVFKANEGEEYSWLWIDLISYTNIGGVLVTTHPEKMTGGTFGVYVFSGEDNLDLGTDRANEARCDM